MSEETYINIYRDKTNGGYLCAYLDSNENITLSQDPMFEPLATVEPSTWIEALLNQTDVSNNDWVKITLSKTP